LTNKDEYIEEDINYCKTAVTNNNNKNVNLQAYMLILHGIQTSYKTDLASSG